MTEPGYRPWVNLRTHATAVLATLTLGATLLTPAAAAAGPGARSDDRAADAANAHAPARVTTTRLAERSFETGPQLRQGRWNHTFIRQHSLRIKKVNGTRRMAGARWDQGRWTSPWVTTPFGFNELIPSWQAHTPGRSWVLVRARVRAADGTVGTWDTVARWTANGGVPRTTLGSQADSLSRMAVDTLRTNDPAGARAWQLRVVLLRPEGGKAKPRLERIGAVASRVGARSAVSQPGPAAGKVLDVPAYSQMTHRGHYPQWGNGGEAWCSPTSTAMVLQYYGVHPRPARNFGPAGHQDGVVDWTAKKVYDHGYRGTGNWAFNTAYAGRFLTHTRVTRLHGLRATERFINAGTPVIVSVAFGSGQLRGSPINSTAGHLMVVVGFTASGDVVVNDPAAPSNSTVRRTYDRAQFERAWLGGSGGVAYILED